MSGPGYCHHCNNTGWLDCYCGGDLCVCENNGEEPCFYCDGGAAEDDDEDYEHEMTVRDTGDDLGQILAEALKTRK